jgi:curli biogenesis system outer membrane secretion channel CsgG
MERRVKFAIAASACFALAVGATLINPTCARADQTIAPPISRDATPHLRYRVVLDQGKWEQIRTEQWSLPPDVRDGIQSQLLEKLQKSGYFIVMEREKGAMQQMNQEDQIAQKKRESIGDAPAAPPAREQRTAANFIITPSVIGFKMTNGEGGGISIGGIRLGEAKTSASLTLNIRISDAQTSEILDTQTSQGSSDSSAFGIKLRVLDAGFKFSQFKSSPAGKAVDEALDKAVDKIVARLSNEPWTALVAAQDTETSRVIINAGSASGVREGMEFNIFRAGKVVRDPDTGEIISKGDETRIGRIKIVRVEKNAAYGEVLWGKRFEVRDLVRQAF